MPSKALRRAALLMPWLVAVGVCQAETALPPDVLALIEQKANCDSLRGDIPDPTPDDPGNVARAVTAANQACEPLARTLAALKHKYAADPALSRRLAEPNLVIAPN